MEQDTRKNSTLKTLAVIGFVAVVIGGVWLAVQTVQHAPDIFARLAGVADRVYGPSEEEQILLSPNKALVNDGETFELAWQPMDRPGEFFITYACVDEVSVAVTNADGEFIETACEELFPLENRTKTLLRITSGEGRFVDVPFELVFREEGAETPLAMSGNSVTVVNATIPETGTVAGAADSDTGSPMVVADERPEDTVDVIPEPEPTPAPEPTPTPTQPTPTPQPTYEYRYEVPSSDPNGYAELALSYLGVGHIVDGAFDPQADIDNDAEGAIRIAVKNIGTKTSDEWSYEVELPNGQTYEADNQEPLRPNETATLTLGFNPTETGHQSFSASIYSDDDRLANNNSFEWGVTVTN